MSQDVSERPHTGHRRRRTIDHLDLTLPPTQMPATTDIETTDSSPRLLLSPLSPTSVLDSSSIIDHTSGQSPQRSRVRSRAQRPGFPTASSSSQPPRSPSHKIAQRLASPPISPIGSRSGLSRILALHEDDEQPRSSPATRPSARLNSDSILPVSSSGLFAELGRTPTTPDRSHHQRHASASAIASSSNLLSRSTSLRSDRADRYQYGSRHSRHRTIGSSEELPLSAATATPPRDHRDWSARARRWSSSMSRRMSISAINETISSTTSPYLKAGLDELRSIFDVDTIGLGGESRDQYRISAGDLEECSVANDDDDSSADEGSARGHAPLRAFRPGTFQFPRRLDLDDAFDSPQDMSEHSSRSLSRQPTVARPASSAHRHANGARASRTGSGAEAVAPDAEESRGSTEHDKGRTLAPALALPPRQANESRSPRKIDGTSRPKAGLSDSLSSPAITAVGLAAIAIAIVALCSLEVSIHPDAASLPLVAFMLAQPVFAVAGLAGLLLQRRWLMDLSSRLVRAHVLCQVLIALAALRNLSSSAIYHHRAPLTAASALAVDGKLITKLRFSRFDADEDPNPYVPTAFDPATTPHQSNVGSLQDQLTYLAVFVVQAALPLLAALWAQYAVAMRLSSLAVFPVAAGAPQTGKPSADGRPSRQPSTSRRAPSTTLDMPEQQQEAPRELKLAPAPILDFELDPSDLTSRLERVRTDSLQSGTAEPPR
ncbi:uncharacterized protein PFL1_00976 [Pseudozyma flocculosa PF-1]|uniref:Uncharacterized protein n=1 Tax=Pseudozyma flocculosa TaxID=84751 RepID=A0A5C3FAN3_9BASI|nr:uncharacterized protein PFL1_00976 [Pseudozyma flocculosa PF-1]EPQ31643.1 hypothetical protein PFL1_00976 [Pseudozyma flocculosa PF-1]SPO40757.1 uncharacterized protein PSFLO_06239 [Pseudozyma flocculosa]